MSALSRRALLRGAGGAALALPFLSAMLRPGRSVAQTAEIPKRFVVFFSGNGTIASRWRPSGSPTDFTLGEILAPLEPHKRDLVVLEGIDMLTARHASGGRNGHDIGMGHMLCARPLREGPSSFGEFGHLWDGSAGGISIDQEIANRLGEGYRFRSLELGVRTDIRQAIPTRMSWRAPFEPVLPIQEPGAAFDRLFGGEPPGTTSAERRRARRRLVVDRVRGDYERLTTRLGADDRRRVTAHLDAVREIERRIESTRVTSCEIPERRTASDDGDKGRIHLDLMALALGCELTPVASMQWWTGQGYGPVRQLGIDRGHHDLSHDGDSNAESQDRIARINRWYAEQFAYLLDRMKAIDDGAGGTLLDHTVVLWVNELGKGNNHAYEDIPYVLAGGAGGAIRTGRWLRYDSVGHGELFVAIQQALGIEATTFGHPDHCRGALPDLLG